MNVTKAALEALSAGLRADLAHGDRHAAELANWRQTPPVGYEVHAAALLLHHLYGAIEAIAERALKTFDGVTLKGEDFHIKVLELASKEVERLRPAILPQSSALDELRRFRHRFRKRYNEDLEVGLLHPIIQSAIGAWPQIRDSLAAFGAFVDECIEVAG